MYYYRSASDNTKCNCIQYIIVYIIMILMSYIFFLIGVSWDSKTSTLISKLIMVFKKKRVCLIRFLMWLLTNKFWHLSNKRNPGYLGSIGGSYYTQVWLCFFRDARISTQLPWTRIFYIQPLELLELVGGFGSNNFGNKSAGWLKTSPNISKKFLTCGCNWEFNLIMKYYLYRDS